MALNKSFRNTAVGGFNKEDVLNYIDEMTENARTLEAGLKSQLNSLASSRSELSNKVSSFEEQVKELEQQLGEERSNLREIASLRDELYVELQVKQQELDTVVSRREKDIAECEREIAMYLEHKLKLTEELQQAQEKGNKYDEIQKDLKRIRLDAESDAFRMVEEAKVQSMEAVSVVDDVKEEIDTFKEDIGQLRSDLSIGTVTLEDRLDSLYYTLDSYVQKLCGIKAQFYATNGIPINENDFVCTPPQVQPEEPESESQTALRQETLPEEPVEQEDVQEQPESDGEDVIQEQLESDGEDEIQEQLEPADKEEVQEPVQQDTEEVDSDSFSDADEPVVPDIEPETDVVPEIPCQSDEVSQPLLTAEDSAPVAEQPTRRFIWDDEEAADEDEYDGF